MKLIVNGKAREMPDNATVADLVRDMAPAGAACAAEVNKRLVPKREHAERALREGDAVEIVTLVGGG